MERKRTWSRTIGRRINEDSQINARYTWTPFDIVAILRINYEFCKIASPSVSGMSNFFRNVLEAYLERFHNLPDPRPNGPKGTLSNLHDNEESGEALCCRSRSGEYCCG